MSCFHSAYKYGKSADLSLPTCLCRPNEKTSACIPPLLTRPILAPSRNRVLTSETRWQMNLPTGAQVQNLTEPACSNGARFPAEVHLDVSWRREYACCPGEQGPSHALSRASSGNEG